MLKLVRGKVLHQRKTPFKHGLKFVNYMWLIDLDETLPGFVRSRLLAKDHFGGDAGSLKDAVVHFAKSRGAKIEATDRFYMIASARTQGYVFNPLSVYWCIDKSGQTKWSILEIHNTYGQRHAHLLYPDEKGNSKVAKEFYVSPFFTIDGEYQTRTYLNLTENKVVLSVNLHQNNALVFSASFTGELMEASIRNRILARLRTPFSTIQAMVRIRAHGIWLWARRLPVIPRPVHPKQNGML